MRSGSEVLVRSMTPSAEEELKILIRDSFGKLDGKFALMEQRFNELSNKVDVESARVQGSIATMKAELDGDIKNSETRVVGKIDALESRLDQKIDALESKLDKKIDALENKLDKKIDALESKLDKKIDALENKLDKKIDALENKLENKIDTLGRELRSEFKIHETKLDERTGGFEKRLANSEQLTRTIVAGIVVSVVGELLLFALKPTASNNRAEKENTQQSVTPTVFMPGRSQ
jgi:Skp family chaperone for outer membrane proteins